MKLLYPKQIVSNETWNVRTVREDSQLHILAKELDNWKCDILGISETHRRDREKGTSRSGVGMFLGKNAQKALVEYNPVSDRILLVRFGLSFVGYLVVVQVYAPTSEASLQQEIDSFYNLLQSAVNEQSALP